MDKAQPFLFRMPHLLTPLRRWLVRRFGRNSDFKVLAGILSAAFILLIGHSLRDERTFTVTVEQTHTPTGVVVKEVSPRNVSVTLYGKKALLEQVSSSRLRISVDLADAAGKGSLLFPMTAKQVANIPEGLSVRALSTSEVRVSLDKNIRKFEVPKEILATPVLNGTGSLQGWVEDVVIKTDKLLFYGPEDRINEFLARGVRLTVSPIDLTGHIDSFETDLAIDIPESSGITAILPNPVPAFVKIVIEKNKETDRIVEESKLVEEDDPVPASEPAPEGTESSSAETEEPVPESPLDENVATTEETTQEEESSDAE